MIGKTLWTEFFTNRDWPLASAVAVILLLILVVPIVVFQNVEARRLEAAPMKRRFSRVQPRPRSTLGFAFLYLPILLLVIYSFNASRLVTVWGGFSTQVVRRAARERGAPRRRLGDAPRRAPLGDASRPCSARWRRSRWCASAASAAARSSPAWSTRRWSCRR